MILKGWVAIYEFVFDPEVEAKTMFTGIVEARGTLFERKQTGDDLTIAIDTKADIRDTQVGDSIAVSGACLTVVKVQGRRLWFDVSSETLRCTRFGRLIDSAQVNSELALPVSGRYGGHLVTGHVDGLGRLDERIDSSRSVKMAFSCSSSFAPYLATKGSVCLDGVSLTVNKVKDSTNRLIFEINVIPHTILVTTLGSLRVGEPVHIEFDQIARYVERLISWQDRDLKL